MYDSLEHALFSKRQEIKKLQLKAYNLLNDIQRAKQELEVIAQQNSHYLDVEQFIETGNLQESLQEKTL